MVIRILDVVSGADTADQGDRAFNLLHKALSKKNTEVTVSFDGVKTATSSFVNVAFVQLLDSFSFSDIKARLRVVDSTRQINDMIKSRMEREAVCAA
jgi:hypothetical protein